jgi:hypothetical protein
MTGMETRTRIAIEGWKVRYYEPTYGTREFLCTGSTAVAELAKAKGWLDQGGYSYTVTVVR